VNSLKFASHKLKQVQEHFSTNSIIISVLDAQTSHEVINEILSLDSMTRILVTHSLEEALLRRYDEIIVIKDGTIEEKGCFDTLIDNDGYFKALYTITQ
jgi:ABC-type multidrug transport system fused ATPase/permease subunit